MTIPTAIIILLGFWVWCLVVHLAREIYWIARHFPNEPPPCGLWWCPQTWAIWIDKILTRS